ncbi:MAG: hypothetical protein ACK5BV_02675 [Bacteroidota bacterium]|jgi:hypothetical protein
MKHFLPTILTILLSYLSGAFLPWWTFVPITMIIFAFMPLKPGMAFLSGFIALLIVWGGLAWMMDTSNHHILSKKIAQLFLKNDQYSFLILITTVIGALLGGLSALTGSLGRSAFLKR